MEKIYEEKSLSQGGQKQRRISFASILSFVVAAFAIVSLIAVGFYQISYAAPSDAETMTLYFGMFDSMPAYIEGTGSDGHLRVQMMFSDKADANTATNPVFCIQHGVDPTAAEDAYQSQGEILDDLGLIYLINTSKVMNPSSTGIVTGSLTYPDGSGALSAEDAKFVEYYATQAAIWMYMYENPAYTGTAYHGQLESEHQLETLKGTISLASSKNPTKVIYQGNLYDAYVADAVYKAKNVTNYKTVEAKLASKNISVVNDDDTYQTDKIYVEATPKDDLVNYSVDLSGIDGAYIVDANGRTRTSVDVFAPGDYFYIRVPINKVTQNNTKVNIEIIAEFDNYFGGEAFAASGAQSVVAITHENFRIANHAEVNFMVAPDTGMTTAQTIYFIGLIVLLCGVGIIYANAKPVEE